MDILIREAEPEDAGRVDQLLTELIHDEAQYDKNLDHTCMITDNYSNRIGLDGHQLFVAEKEGKIIGYLYGFLYHVPNIWLNPVAILDALYVDKNYRRQGVATRLVSKFKEFAKASGAYRMELKVVSENEEAVELYKKLAFTETKKYMNSELLAE